MLLKVSRKKTLHLEKEVDFVSSSSIYVDAELLDQVLHSFQLEVDATLEGSRNFGPIQQKPFSSRTKST